MALGSDCEHSSSSIVSLLFLQLRTSWLGAFGGFYCERGAHRSFSRT